MSTFALYYEFDFFCTRKQMEKLRKYQHPEIFKLSADSLIEYQFDMTKGKDKRYTELSLENIIYMHYTNLKFN